MTTIKSPAWKTAGVLPLSLTKLVSRILRKAVVDLDIPNLASEETCQSALDGKSTSAKSNQQPVINEPKKWEVPKKVIELPPVPKFDVSLLPSPIADWVIDVAKRMQCPIDFVAVSVITTVSSLIGARAVVQPKAKDDWKVVPNLWALIVGRPGQKKSPALSQSMKFVHLFEKSAFQKWEREHKTWKSQSRQMQCVSNLDKMLFSELDPEPVQRRFIVVDVTVEKLGEILRENPWGLLIYRDELYGLLTSLDKPGQEGSRSFYLQAYDGNQGYVFDRISRGQIHIPRICFSMLGGIQPSRLQDYVSAAVTGGRNDDGLLQRFSMAVWPDNDLEYVYVDEFPDEEAEKRAAEVFNRLSKIKPLDDSSPVVWHFDEGAQPLFATWLTNLERSLNSGVYHFAVESHLSKFRKLVPALSLIFAMIEDSEKGIIDRRHLFLAIEWSKYLEAHANRIYSASSLEHKKAATRLLEKIKAGEIGTQFTPRVVAQRGWTSLQSPDLVRRAAEVLIQHGWLQSTRIETGGRPSEVYEVNPAVFNK